jgi:glycosyltransferase involved in cell wall biosynthesis
MISVLHATAWYPPGYMGGTEVYLTGLVRELRGFGVDSRILAPLGSEAADGYEFDGAVVRTYSVNPSPSRAELRDGAPHQGFERFYRILAEERPHIYHQHSWSRGLGAAHLRAAREAGLRTVVTVHTPNNICLRGTMMRYGEETCDGRIDPLVCGSCWSHERGVPAILARALGAMPAAASANISRSIPASRVATALSARMLGERRKGEFARMVADADRIVAVCAWLLDALKRNGVPPEKLVLSRQGIDPAFAADAAAAVDRRESHYDSAFRLLYLGRLHPVKGIDVLIKAVRRLPQAVGLKLIIHGVGAGAEERDYAVAMRRLAEGDHRISFEPPVPRDQLAATLAWASALAVPSLGLETGPLVVLEAKATGLPIIGSRLGGIAELVHEPEDGVLVPSDDVSAWAAAIKKMASDYPSRALAGEREKVRTMHEAASEMAALYKSLC